MKLKLRFLIRSSIFFFWAFLVMALIGAGWLSARNIVLKHRIETILEKKMGLQVHLGSVRSSLFLNRIEVYGVTVENPPVFNRRLFVYLPRVVIMTDLLKLIHKDRLRLYLLDFEIEKINIIRNAEGRLNLTDVAGLVEKSPGMGRTIAADFIRYDIKDALFYDEVEKTASVRAYTIDAYDLTFRDTDSLEDVVDSVIQEVVVKVKLGEILNFATEKLFSNIKDLKKAPSKLADTAVKTSGSFLKFVRQTKTNSKKDTK